MSASYESVVTVNAPKQETKEALHPPGYREGVFPRETLGTNEVIHWEGKPSLASYLVTPFLVTMATAIIILYFLLRVVEVFPDADLSVFFTNEYFWEFIVLPLIAYYVVQIIRWYRTSFAITNLRVLTKYGVFTTVFCDCRHEKIQNSVIIESFWQWILSYGTLLFATGGHTGGIAVGKTAKMKNGGGIYWVGVPQPYEIKRYCEDIVNYSVNQIKKKDAERLSIAIKSGGLRNEMVSTEGNIGEDMRASGQMENIRPPQGPVPKEEKIAYINRLKDDGIISWDDYERMRKKIVGIE